ncbi:hypothetical protein MESS4_430015 [Mesorhizobium sp. STM 4661]|nr:hypothetical protein MESS4_430015 [Mesorhizobium sp. STM 4661]
MQLTPLEVVVAPLNDIQTKPAEGPPMRALSGIAPTAATAS